MKNKAVKKIAAILLAIFIAVTFVCNAFAETIQDRLERELEALVEKYSTAEPETQQSLQEMFNQFLEENNLKDMDLSGLTDTDIAKIISDIGNNLAMDDFLALAEEAWASGTDMIKDVLGGGKGTADGSNTATTQAMTTMPQNVIIAGTTSVAPTSAVGVIATVESTTAEATTYNIGETTAPAIVGAGVTTGETASAVAIEDEGGMSTASIAVLVVLAVSTIAVIVAIVIFFVMKKK